MIDNGIRPYPLFLNSPPFSSFHGYAWRPRCRTLGASTAPQGHARVGDPEK